MIILILFSLFTLDDPFQSEEVEFKRYEEPASPSYLSEPILNEPIRFEREKVVLFEEPEVEKKILPGPTTYHHINPRKRTEIDAIASWKVTEVRKLFSNNPKPRHTRARHQSQNPNMFTIPAEDGGRKRGVKNR